MLSTKIAGLTALFFIILIVADCALWIHYTHEEIVVSIKSPVPVHYAEANELVGHHGWGGVAGSSVLKVDNESFWNYAREFGQIWLVGDSRGWHVITFGNGLFAYELLFVDYADKVVWSSYEIKFYTPVVEYERVWSNAFVIGILGLFFSIWWFITELG